jgi:hypothetical protein
VKILITNDDSISSEVLLPLAKWAKQFGEVTVVVPKFEQSGKSHCIEIHKPFEVKQVPFDDDDIKAYTVDSSPADCVRFALEGMKCSFDLVISGINRGLNLGIDVSGANKFSDAVFEYIPYAKEGTNFDFYLKLDNDKQITLEIKFTEKDFGGTTGGGASDKYIAKYENVYIPMLRECAYYDFPDIYCDDYHCLNTGMLTDDCDARDKCSIYEFYKYYQIRRNILYARTKEDYVLFLTPRENHELDSGRAYIERYAKKWGTDHIRNIYWEDLLETTLSVVFSVPELYDYYTKFKDKYFAK